MHARSWKDGWGTMRSTRRAGVVASHGLGKSRSSAVSQKGPMIGLREHDQKLTKPRPKQTIPDQANKKAPKRINHLGAITGGGGGTNPADSGNCLIFLHWPTATASKLPQPWYLGCDPSFDRFRPPDNPCRCLRLPAAVPVPSSSPRPLSFGWASGGPRLRPHLFPSASRPSRLAQGPLCARPITSNAPLPASGIFANAFLLTFRRPWVGESSSGRCGRATPLRRSALRAGWLSSRPS